MQSFKVCNLGILFFCIFCFCGPGQAWAEDVQLKNISLSKAFYLSLKHNQRLMGLKQEVMQARQDYNIAQAPLLPQLVLEGESAKQKQHSFLAVDHYNTLSFGVSQHLYQGGKLHLNKQAQRARSSGEQFQYYRQAQETLFDVASSFYNVLLAERSIEIAKNQLKRTKRQLERAKQRFKVGLVNKTAVLRAQVQVAQSKEQLERSRNQKNIALENLSLEIGLDTVPNGLNKPEELKFEDRDVDHYCSQAYKYRRDIDYLKKLLKSANKGLKAEKADFWPKLSLEGRYSVANEQEYFYGDHKDWRISFKGEYDLFTGWKDSAEIQKYRAKIRQLKAELKRLKQAVRVQVRSVYLDIKTQENVIKSLQDQVDSAMANYDQIVAQFDEGLASSVDVVDAQTALNEAENRLANAYYSYQLDQLRLKLMMGTLAQEPLARHIAEWDLKACENARLLN